MTYDMFTYPFTNRTEVIIPGTLHQLGTAALAIQVSTADNPSWPIWFAIDPDTNRPVHPITQDVTLTFLWPQSGIVRLKALWL